MLRRRLFLALSSAILLIVSFPNFNQPWCAWVALLPWLLLLQEVSDTSQSGTSARHFVRAFWWSYVVGLVFFFGSIWWLIHVTFVGLIALCLYLALYFGCFGWFVCKVLDQRQETRDQKLKTQDPRRFSALSLVSSLMSHVSSLIVIPSAWVALEYLRSYMLLLGFGWNLLGYSQSPSLSAIQLADVTGVWGVSFLLIMMNVALLAFLREQDLRRRLVCVGLAVGATLAAWSYGQLRLKQEGSGVTIRMAVVQGNIPQGEKWSAAFRESILQRYEHLTQEAATQSPQLIIWPETSVPGYLGLDELDEDVTARVQHLAQSVKVPLLVGAPMGTLVGKVIRPTNSAALLDETGHIVSRYDKLHLVPFGEFVPFESVFPWLRKLLPPIGAFIPGHDYTVFQPSGLPAFGVLVCFEDIFPSLARGFVRHGAQWLITITNDAWFGRSAAAYQHAQASTFRAVELRMPMVRAANTGWSGCIDAKGRWLSSVRNQQGEELFVGGIALCETALDKTRTLYQRWGDWFAGLCLLLAIGWLVATASKGVLPLKGVACGCVRIDGVI